ncbi:major facilitator superfamily domain-containing protein [Dipodascopsis tothii]|uniref:major facilitator superfamily domain-containing protein n=1 Tax=Dipodascopsis tothii TaxID=44089 RepID=UPI0034CF52CD
MARPTVRLILHVAVVCLGALQFGYHLSELNAPEAYISCQVKYLDAYTDELYGPADHFANSTGGHHEFGVPGSSMHAAGPHGGHHGSQSSSGLVDCIPMDANQIGLINSIFSIGGLLSATVAGRAADRFGRKGLTMVNCVSYIIGPVIMATATNFGVLMLGRFVSGIGSGAALIVIPMYLNEISPLELSGAVGAMCQLFVNIGILLAQVMGIFFSSFVGWRVILSGGGVIAVANLLLAPFCYESPKWMVLKNRTSEARRIIYKLRGLGPETADGVYADIELEIAAWRETAVGTAAADADSLDSIEPVASSYGAIAPSKEALLDGDDLASISDRSAEPAGDFAKVSYREFLTSRRYRSPLVAVLLVLTAQQFCGINTMIFYGVTILRELFPTATVLINVLISTLNVLVNAAVSPFVDRVGRKPLIMASMLGMSVSAALLGIGILKNVNVLSAIAATVFVAMFSVGLGPIPFLIIPEFTDASSVGVAQSVGFTCNWVSIFIVGYLFPILNQAMGGAVFFLLAAIAASYFLASFKLVPETKGKTSMEQVWGDKLL